MARPKSKLNEASSAVIEDNFLEQNPNGLPDKVGLVMSNHVPEMREITFINERDPGYVLEFHYHSKTHPLKHYTLYHGQDHLLPVEIIDHLENCAQRIYGYQKGRSGQPEMYTKSLKYNFRCKTVKK